MIKLAAAGCIAALVCSSAIHATAQDETHITPEFRDGDRIAILGATLIERMGANGFLESRITAAYPGRNLVFRNLGWSGDNVFGHARAVFGAPKDGFARLERDLLATKPTVVLICYGGNEAHQGEDGLDEFAAGLKRLLDVVEKAGARAVLVSPRKYEYKGRRFLDPEDYNRSLARYCGVMAETAAERGLPYVDLYSNQGGHLTDNGVHVNPFGYWRLGPRLARELAIPEDRWELDIDFANASMEAVGTSILALERGRNSLTLTVQDARLSYCPPPPHAPNKANLLVRHGSLRVRGLPAGSYIVRIDGEVVLATDYNRLAQGVELPERGGAQQAEELRRAIVKKNEHVFHRYRPQNETYLFLFRKHEQGNNAVEVPQFDPLIEEMETEIARLRQPRRHKYEIIRSTTTAGR